MLPGSGQYKSSVGVNTIIRLSKVAIQMVPGKISSSALHVIPRALPPFKLHLSDSRLFKEPSALRWIKCR